MGTMFRWASSGVLLAVGLLLTVAAMSTVMVDRQLLDTDGYVATVAPLADDPVLKDAVADRLTDEVMARTDLAGLSRQLSDFLVRQGAPAQLGMLVGPAVSGARTGLRGQIRAITDTSQFAAAWQAANRLAHGGIVTALTGRSDGAVRSSGTTISVDLGILLDTVKQRLTAAGYTLADRIPLVPVEFTILSSPELPKIRGYVRLVGLAASWLPLAAVAVLAAAVAAAPNRRRGLVLLGTSLTIVMVLTLAAMRVAQVYYQDRLPVAVSSPQALMDVVDAVLGRTRETLKTLAWLGAALAVAGLLAGPGRLAVALRALTDRGLDLLAAALGRPTAPPAGLRRTVASHPRAAELTVVAVAVAVLALLGFTATAAWLLSAAALILVVTLEVTTRRHRHADNL